MVLSIRRDTLFNIYYVKCLLNIQIKPDNRIQKDQKYYWQSMIAEQVLRRSTTFKYCRAYLEPYYDNFTVDSSNDVNKKDSCVFRNWELTYDTNRHEPLIKFPTTTVLQEYFIPINKDSINIFMEKFNKIIDEYSVNILNISLRYVRASENKPILDYTLNYDAVLAVVIYYNIDNNSKGLEKAKMWTQEILDTLLSDKVKGSYYLPYLPFASIDQFRKAYPNYRDYISLKKEYDSSNRFTSQFLEDYKLIYFL